MVITIGIADMDGNDIQSLSAALTLKLRKMEDMRGSVESAHLTTPEIAI